VGCRAESTTIHDGFYSKYPSTIEHNAYKNEDLSLVNGVRDRTLSPATVSKADSE
jgi:hypothetical protein